MAAKVRRVPAKELGEPHVSDPCDDTLVEERLTEEPRRIGPVQAADHAIEVEIVREQIGPQPRYRPRVEREHGAVPLHRLPLLAAQHEPGPADVACAATFHAPASAQPEMATQRDAALEAQQQVLADGDDALQHALVDRGSDSGGPGPRMGGLGFDSLSHEHLQAGSGSMHGVTFRHQTWPSTGVKTGSALTRKSSIRPKSGVLMSTLLNIAAISRRTGVAPDTLRKWEQRYGVLRPERTKGGQRRYTEQDTARVEWLRDRVTEGWRIGEAARVLQEAQAPPLEEPDALRQALVEAACDGRAVCVPGLLDQVFAVLPLEHALTEVVAPALRELGDAWCRGEVSVAEEHAVSTQVRARLDQLIADARGGVRGTAVLACAPASTTSSDS